MTTAEQIAALVRVGADAKAVDTYEAVVRFRSYSRRCELAAEWLRTIEKLEANPLAALPAQIVRESSKQLAALQATIKQTLQEASERGDQ